MIKHTNTSTYHIICDHCHNTHLTLVTLIHHLFTSTTITHLREQATQHGWTNHNNTDLCPKHTNPKTQPN